MCEKISYKSKNAGDVWADCRKLRVRWMRLNLTGELVKINTITDASLTFHHGQ